MSETTGSNSHRSVALLLEHFSFVVTFFCFVHYHIDMVFCLISAKGLSYSHFHWDVVITSVLVLGGGHGPG